VTVRYAKRLEALPHYEGGMDLERARRIYETDEVIKLASNESPWGPHPAVVEAVTAAAAGANRYPDQYAALLRERIAARYDFDPAGIAVANGSCEILLAAALALCEPGAEIIFAWPAFSMYPQLAPLSGCREIRVPLDGYLHDLEAMLEEVTAATQIVLVCNPNNPTGTYHPAERIAAFCEQLPGHVTVLLDEAYIELQVVDDPFATVDLLRRFPNLVLLRTFSKVYGLAGLRCGYALGSARFRAAVDAVRQPFSVNLLAQAAGAEAILHQDDVERRIERTVAERIGVEEELHEIGLQTAETQTNFSWIDLGGRDDAEVVAELGRAGVIVRGGTPLGGPGHIRVNYGAPAENRRLLEALRTVLEAPAV
jgi:histidinol-phosphate aminotransferase